METAEHEAMARKPKKWPPRGELDAEPNPGPKGIEGVGLSQRLMMSSGNNFQGFIVINDVVSRRYRLVVHGFRIKLQMVRVGSRSRGFIFFMIHIFQILRLPKMPRPLFE